MTKVADISNHPDAALRRLKEWRKNPVLMPAHAAEIAGLSKQRMHQLIRAGKVETSFDVGRKFVEVDSLILYFRRRVSRRSMEGIPRLL